VNFDVPHTPDDYIHRVGRTARAAATGDAFTFVAPEEVQQVRAIEQATGRTIQRRMLRDFAYDAHTDEKLEIPLRERLAAVRTRRTEERARATARPAQRRTRSRP
jgi:ATP-dependent RNA helicase RhlE